MSEMELTAGAIREIRVTGENCVQEPVLQCLSVKKVGNNTANGDRYRAIVSDGVTFQQAMFATQLNGLAEEGQITKFTIIKLLEYTVNMVKDRMCVVTVLLLEG
jgi:replication factor A1